MNASNLTRPNMVIAVDGPSGSGKSSISKESAHRLGFNFLDTGAMYRSVTWFCVTENLNEEELIIERINNKGFKLDISTDPLKDQIKVNDEDVSKIIREDAITSQVSHFSAMPKIRQFLVSKQRELVKASNSGIIVEGRDIGSVVLPEADFKIFITANDDVRAKRRAIQIESNEDDVLVAQRKRDFLDSSRKVSPLVIPAGAVILDNSDLNFEQSVEKFIDIVSAK
ncbi:MAG: (d)CMP kinase [Actinobacteria bacterium]|nr:(d)CMP kinase [Actinomycetota bacterium]